MNLFKKLVDSIGRSITGNEGKTSSTRISSYFILGAISTIAFIFVLIEVINAIIVWKTAMPYVIPGEHITIFGMILAHHLTLLGINKTAETKVEQARQDKMKSLNQLNPKDMPTEAPQYPETPKYSPGEEGPSDSGNI
jgi:hypothetical protein